MTRIINRGFGYTGYRSSSVVQHSEMLGGIPIYLLYIKPKTPLVVGLRLIVLYICYPSCHWDSLEP